jgi:hypothetical protein
VRHRRANGIEDAAKNEPRQSDRASFAHLFKALLLNLWSGAFGRIINACRGMPLTGVEPPATGAATLIQSRTASRAIAIRQGSRGRSDMDRCRARQCRESQNGQCCQRMNFHNILRLLFAPVPRWIAERCKAIIRKFIFFARLPGACECPGIFSHAAMTTHFDVELMKPRNIPPICRLINRRQLMWRA